MLTIAAGDSRQRGYGQGAKTVSDFEEWLAIVDRALADLRRVRATLQ